MTFDKLLRGNILSRFGNIAFGFENIVFCFGNIRSRFGKNLFCFGIIHLFRLINLSRFGIILLFRLINLSRFGVILLFRLINPPRFGIILLLRGVNLSRFRINNNLNWIRVLPEEMAPCRDFGFPAARKRLPAAGFRVQPQDEASQPVGFTILRQLRPSQRVKIASQLSWTVISSDWKAKHLAGR